MLYRGSGTGLHRGCRPVEAQEQQLEISLSCLKGPTQVLVLHCRDPRDQEGREVYERCFHILRNRGMYTGRQCISVAFPGQWKLFRPGGSAIRRSVLDSPWFGISQKDNEKD